MIIDFLFYYTSLHYERLNRLFGIGNKDIAKGSRNLLFMSSFIWFLITLLVINYIKFDSFGLIDLSFWWILIVASIIFIGLTYFYISGKRFEKVNQREKGLNKRFGISDKSGKLIACFYVYSGIVVIIGMIIYTMI